MLAGSPYDDLRQSATVLISVFHHVIEIVGYLEDSTDFGQTPVSERHGFTVLYFLYFHSCLLIILEKLKCDDVSHDCFFRHLAKYTYI